METIWTVKEIAQACSGKIIGPESTDISGVKIDSRIVEDGDLFIALKGENTDGHQYINKAFAMGASAVLAEESAMSDQYNGTVIAVENCLTALNMLAKYKRQKSRAKFVAVTGSVGKTTTKEMLQLALSNYGKTFATKGNFNNELGLPISMCQIPNDAEFVVLELGMSEKGEISRLSNLCQPDIAIITAIAPAHMENFNSLNDVALAKSEIFEGVTNKNENKYNAIINSEAVHFDTLKNKALEQALKILSYSKEEISNYSELEGFADHIKSNMMAVIKTVTALGLDTNNIADVLANFKSIQGRGQEFDAQINGNKITVIDESYNANPMSVQAALNACKNIDGGKVAILGDMLELGEDSRQFHEELLGHIEKNGFSKLICIGELMQHLHNAAKNQLSSQHFSDVEEFLPNLLEHIDGYNVLLVKGSNSIGLGRIIKELRENAL